jgi:hypothetical protein
VLKSSDETTLCTAAAITWRSPIRDSDCVTTVQRRCTRYTLVFSRGLLLSGEKKSRVVVSMFSFLSNSNNPVNKNFKRNLNKLDYIVLSSMRHNTHKKNYNAGAVILIRKIKPRVNSGNIRGAQKENFRRVYNKYGSIVNESAASAWAQKIANDPYLMKRFFNRRNRNRILPVGPNRQRLPNNRRPVGPNRQRLPNNRRPVVPNRRLPVVPNRRLPVVPHQSKCLFKKLSMTGKPIFKCS